MIPSHAGRGAVESTKSTQASRQYRYAGRKRRCGSVGSLVVYLSHSVPLAAPVTIVFRN